MSLAVVHSRALDGLAAPAVTVEVHLANGLPGFMLVGLADTEVKEARERVRAALQSVGLGFPHNRRITVNLAPADLPKESGRFDLPIALGILAATGVVDAQRLAQFEFAGELSLAGDLRPVRGALAMALALQRDAQPRQPAGPPQGRIPEGTARRHSSARALVLPAASAAQAALADGTRVHAATHLLEVVRALLPMSGETPAAELPLATPLPRPAAAEPPDLRDVKGQAGAKRALEIAAAGGHSLLMIGPPGTGKSMLAQRLVGLLPPLSHDEALESAALLSLADRFAAEQWGWRVLRQPHHSASSVALVGGGSPPRPGEISLAHHGVLFLDELPEWQRSGLEALREPLETGRITISRAARRADFPARFQLVAAMNPCPCGHFGDPHRACRCTPDAVARYQGRLSGPLLDRIDLRVEVAAVAPQTLAAAPDGDATASVAQRVAAARERALSRQGVVNAMLAADALDAHAALDAATTKFLHTAATRLGWSARSHHRVLRMARTIADLAGSATITTSHVAEAMQYRRLP